MKKIIVNRITHFLFRKEEKSWSEKKAAKEAKEAKEAEMGAVEAEMRAKEAKKAEMRAEMEAIEALEAIEAAKQLAMFKLFAKQSETEVAELLFTTLNQINKKGLYVEITKQGIPPVGFKVETNWDETQLIQEMFSKLNSLVDWPKEEKEDVIVKILTEDN